MLTWMIFAVLLNFCTGVKGVKMLYDAFFKEIMNLETVPERLEDFLGVLLQRKVKIVYTIVLIDKSAGEFHKYKDIYCHIFQQKSDTGLELNLLQKYVFLPLDIFRESMHNKGITDKLGAWLTFLSMDSPEVIVELIEKYPEFRAMYEHIYNICQNVEGMMKMYSEELKILDRNTVKYMVDQMQEQIDSQKEKIDNQREQLAEKEREIQELKRKLAEQK